MTDRRIYSDLGIGPGGLAIGDPKAMPLPVGVNFVEPRVGAGPGRRLYWAAFRAGRSRYQNVPRRQ